MTDTLQSFSAKRNTRMANLAKIEEYKKVTKKTAIFSKDFTDKVRYYRYTAKNYLLTISYLYYS